MTAPLTEAEGKFHRSMPLPPQERRWGVTEANEFWVSCCGITSSLRYEDAASAQDAAIDHYRRCGSRDG